MNSLDRSTRVLAMTASVAIVLLLAACTVGPDFETPEATVSPSWYQEEREGLTSTGTEVVAWWEAFGDIQLNRLVEERIGPTTTWRSRPSGFWNLAPSWELPPVYGGRRPRQLVAPPAMYRPAKPAGRPRTSGAPISGPASPGRSTSGAGIDAASSPLMPPFWPPWPATTTFLVLLTAQVVQTYTTIRLTEEQLEIAYQNIQIQQSKL